LAELSHFPRTEDFLRQPVVWLGFELMPLDFLDFSPLEPIPSGNSSGK